MLTQVERVLILKGADMLREVGPRHLIGLANVAREIELAQGDTIYREEDPADVLYIVVEGRVRLSTGTRTISEIGPGEAFGTWALVDDSGRGQRAECLENGLALALHREEFYDVAAGDLSLLIEVVRALAKRLRALVSERPEEARVEGEGIEKPEALVEAESAAATAEVPAETPPPPATGAALESAALGQTPPAPPPGDSVPVPPVAPIEPPADPNR